ncbi:MAG: hypothetical protein LBH92_07485, partial [Bacteroidales bacterium]|nr:hypothetical protein [Bacteroidales bacterium]
MKKILLLAILLSSLYLMAQPPDRFIRYYYPEPNIGTRTDNIIATDYGYILTGTAIDTIGIETGYWKRCFIGVDFNGDVLWEKHYGDKDFWYASYVEMKNCFAKDDLDFYYYLSPVSKVREPELHETFAQLLKMTKMGDTLWTKNYYGDENYPFLILTNLNLLPDGGFALIGYTGIEMYEGSGILEEGHPCLLRIDKDGNELWRQIYKNHMGYFYASSYDPITYRYILVGYRYSFNPHR